jgi:hypothetical protein
MSKAVGSSDRAEISISTCSPSRALKSKPKYLHGTAPSMINNADRMRTELLELAANHAEWDADGESLTPVISI